MPTPHYVRAAFVSALTALLLCLSPVRSSSGQSSRASEQAEPRLVVLLIVDQMRADYIDRFQVDWTGGFKRLLTDGARFTNAAYPYLSTYTCAGHATISTGTSVTSVLRPTTSRSPPKRRSHRPSEMSARRGEP